MEILPRKQQLHHVFILVQVQFFLTPKWELLPLDAFSTSESSQVLLSQAIAPQLFFVLQSCADLVMVGVTFAESYQIIQMASPRNSSR